MSGNIITQDPNIGQVYGKLTIVSFSRKDPRGKPYYNCTCECGGTKEARLDSLKGNGAKHCGCVPKTDPNAHNAYIGQIYGKLTITSFSRKDARGGKYYNCKCECGGTKEARLDQLKNGTISHCGCKNDLSGKTFNRLTVLEKTERRNSGNIIYSCQCVCGNTVDVAAGHLKSGHTQSCGCLDKERKTTHGLSGSSEYTVWDSMIQRCTNENHLAYKHYGGRGISVCDSWRKFENFYSDMGPRPKRTSIDRIDVNGNYEPGNCRWATNAEQMRNTTRSKNLTLNNRTMCMRDWSNELGFESTLILSRLKRGWSVEKALTTPVNESYRRERHHG